MDRGFYIEGWGLGALEYPISRELRGRYLTLTNPASILLSVRCAWIKAAKGAAAWALIGSRLKIDTPLSLRTLFNPPSLRSSSSTCLSLCESLDSFVLFWLDSLWKSVRVVNYLTNLIRMYNQQTYLLFQPWIINSVIKFKKMFLRCKL